MADTTDIITTAAAELRRKAEEKVATPYIKSSVQNEIYTSRILHELQVHQVELEMQNEELRRTIAAKHEHEAHLRNIIQQTPAGYFRMDLEGYFLDVNDAWLRMHGYDYKDEVVGKHFSIVQVNSSSNSALTHLAELQRGVAIPFGEFESRRKDGSVGHHIFSAHPVVHIGTIVGFEWFIIDISERKKAEERLKRKQDMLERTERISHIGSWEWDVATDTVIWSDELFRIVKRDPAEGAPSFAEHLKIYHHEDMVKLKRVVEVALNEGKAFEIELHAIRPNGETRYCLARGFAESTIGGRTTRLFGSLQDISENKQVEDALQKSEETFRTLTENAPVGIYLTDPSGYCLYTNRIWREMSGLTEEEATGRGWEKALHPEDRESIADKWYHSVQSDGRWGYEYRFIIPTGEITWVYGNAFPLKNSTGEITGYIGTNINITERKHAEEEKHKLESRLNQSEKMEAIGQLAGGVAHDFNNKLMAILGYAQLSKMDIHDSDKVLCYLDEIRRAAEHSRDITYRLLAFSRQQVVSPQALEANKVIAESLKSLSRLIGEHVSISFQPSDKLWNIRMDPVQLDQVVMNLAINARDAMPDGGSLDIETRNITMGTESCSSIIDAVPGDYVMVTFCDSGTGMDKKTLMHIFEPFFTTKEVGKGTGLGLATIHGIIRQNSGFIDVTSSVGQGTEFKVYIPRFSEPVIESATKAAGVSTGSCSILLVEDEDTVRNVTSLFLRKIGYTVHEAATPTVALELACDPSIQIDLVLTDYVMPGMNGKVMMEQIHELRPQLLCIYASAFSTEHVQLSEEAHFIQKPYDLIKLSSLLKRVVSGREGK